MTHDLIIRNGTIVDGSGAPAFVGDIAIDGGRIVAVGRVDGYGREEIDAHDRLVTPGFIDVHTHYDGQVTWESTLRPSSNHGVTTVVTGNCGVGFAPCRPADHEALITVMEGVEDIPEIVMAEGIPWDWETFPQYLDALDRRQFDIDVATQIAHSPLRVYVMGQRGVDHEPATTEDCAAMSKLVTDAVGAGAFGVSTSRSHNHRTKAGELAPSVTSASSELFALAQGLREAGAGVFQIITDSEQSPEHEFALMREIALTAQAPLSFTLVQAPNRPQAWQTFLDLLDRANADGLAIKGQVFPRAVGVLFGLDLSFNPFCTRPSYRAIAHLPLAERVQIMRDPAFRARLIAETPDPDPNPMNNMLIAGVERMFALGNPPDYAPPPELALGARARREGRSVLDLAYDELLRDDGHAMLYLPGANYVDGNLDVAGKMLCNPHTIVGLGDGGAHYGLICDASFPTFMLTHWARDIDPAQRLPIETVVASLSHKPAAAVGLTDRGLLRAGYKADLNIIDLPRLKLHAPRTSRDLPAGGRRLTQAAAGFDATIVSGVVIARDGAPTGQLPGRLVRRGALRAA
jgi:N-acyl-D-aspartate/D-glutamate deacylase